MKKSILLGIGLLAVVGVGAYIYLKGKKTTTSSGTDSSATNNTVDKPTTSETNTSAVIPPKATIDTVVSAFAETQTENYKKAKVISKEIEVLTNRLRTLNSDYTRARSQPIKIGNSMTGFFPDNGSGQIKLQINSVEKQMSEKTSQANALGYKILPYGEIEKM
jgi:hypothetical protein